MWKKHCKNDISSQASTVAMENPPFQYVLFLLGQVEFQPAILVYWRVRLQLWMIRDPPHADKPPYATSNNILILGIPKNT